MRRKAATCYSLFDTSIGRCAICWNEQGIRALQLPAASEEATVSRLAGLVPHLVSAQPPAWVEDVAARLRTHLEGDPQPLGDVPLDLSGVGPFAARVYEVLRSEVGPGQTISYGDLARLAGSPRAARAVGQALAKNPIALIVPCHRVLSAGARLNGFSAEGGVMLKARLLALEGSTYRLPRGRERRGRASGSCCWEAGRD